MVQKFYLLIISFFIICVQLQGQIIFEDDFETYAVGDMLNQNPNVWGVWSGSNNASEDIDVSNAYASSGVNSGLIGMGQGPQDVLLNLGNQTTGIFQLDFKMFIPTGRTAYFNIQGALSATGGAGNNGTGIFNSTNLIFNNTQNTTGAAGLGGAYPGINTGTADFTWNYPENEWFDISIKFYPDSSMWQMSVAEFALPMQNMDEDQIVGGIDFFAIDANNEFYIDDVVFAEVALTEVNKKEAIIFSAYPNPVINELFIETDETVNQISVFTILGQEIMTFEPNRISPSIDLENLRPGTYFIKVVTGVKYKTIKVSK